MSYLSKVLLRTHDTSNAHFVTTIKALVVINGLLANSIMRGKPLAHINAVPPRPSSPSPFRSDRPKRLINPREGRVIAFRECTGPMLT